MGGRYEQRIRSQIKRGMGIIGIDWIGMSPQEAEDGGADRCTDMLLAAGYRPDLKTVDAVIAEFQDIYASGDKLDGKYIRLPQETWIRRGA